MKNYYKEITSRKDTFFLIAGPCVVESNVVCNTIASELVGICQKLDIPLVFKASYRKANRSSNNSFTGIGDVEALEILNSIGKQFKIPVLTDIHESKDAKLAAKYVDFLQIPAFLCRQSELLIAAGETGLPVNIKKGQFLAAGQMKFAAEKVRSTGNESILLTERGSSFGYQDLVVDFRAIPEMKKTNYSVVFDATHSLQKPNSESGVTGGQPEFIPMMCKTAIAAGANGLFIETHPDPKNALSDGANMLALDQIEDLLISCKKIYNAL